ncbi:hypothetical protein GQ44DRAFT_702942 [Phaeosphaeriaceae sp. PMI808]|nr:hypothetical protein GQ44DRAFT_702942 [Phaeosphaeriaceae sp. PMI808]
MFRDLLCPDNEWVMLVQPRHKPRVASWELPNLSCMLLVLGPKLTVLELPNNFVLRNYGAVHKEVDGIARYFPNLKRLMVPADAVIGSSPMRNISRGLRELILTNGALTRLFTVWIRGVGRLKRKHSPHLSKISGLFLNAVLWLHVPLPIPGAIHRMSTDLQTIWRMMK